MQVEGTRSVGSNVGGAGLQVPALVRWSLA